jgi:RND family efflux transporter MFP subunit
MSENKKMLGRIIRVVAVLAIVALLAFGVIRGINTRIKAAANVKQETIDMSVPTVSVVHPKRGALRDEIVLPGNIQAFIVSPIYARINGYLKKWYVDIGGRAKSGQLLAEIEAPEVDKQLDQSRADLATAEANLTLSQSTMVRWQDLLKRDAVAKQDTDDKIGDYQAKKATVDSGRANVKRLEDMVSFEKVYAPFDGVITARNTDTGALINAGSSGTGPELFHIAETDKLRVYVQVPEPYVDAIKPDLTAELHLAEYPGRTFPAKLVHTADALDSSTRTLLIQLEVDNDKNELLAGGYAEVHLKLPASTASVHLPVNTLIFRAGGMQVATIDNQGHALLKSIQIGRDYGTEVEVKSGVEPDETIIVNPPDSLATGQPVRVAGQPAKDDDGDGDSDDKSDSKKSDDGEGSEK